MKKTQEQRINDEVEKTLRSYDDEARLGENPFLYTRIRAAIDRRGRVPGRIRALQTVLFEAAMVLILALNLFTLAYYYSWHEKQTLNERLVSALKAEYQTDQPTDNF